MDFFYNAPERVVDEAIDGLARIAPERLEAVAVQQLLVGALLLVAALLVPGHHEVCALVRARLRVAAVVAWMPTWTWLDLAAARLRKSIGPVPFALDRSAGRTLPLGSVGVLDRVTGRAGLTLAGGLVCTAVQAAPPVRRGAGLNVCVPVPIDTCVPAAGRRVESGSRLAVPARHVLPMLD